MDKGYLFLALFLPFLALDLAFTEKDLSTLVLDLAETDTPSCEPFDVKNPCQCDLGNGSIIDFSKDGFNNSTARFHRQPINALKPGGPKFSFNPCYPFSDDAEEKDYLNLEPRCRNTMSCFYKKLEDPILDVQVKTGFGKLENAIFFYDSITQQIGIKYVTSALDGNTFNNLTVHFHCVEDQTEPRVTATFDNSSNSSGITVIYSSQCACVDKCKSETTTAEPATTAAPGGDVSSGLSTGSILVILFFTFLVVYILGGITWNVLLRGASGKEVFPNYEFWSGLPGLIGDGVCFIFPCCCRKGTTRSSYDDM